MDISGSPAALGGIMMCVALGAWALGRWQGGLIEPDYDAVQDRGGEPGSHWSDDARPAVATLRGEIPCQDAARAERRLALGAAGPLAEMHAEISAYRRAEQVLADVDSDLLRSDGSVRDQSGDCRYFGLTAEPTCGMPAGARQACACGTGTSAALPAMPVSRPVQPSASVVGFTRV